ncbi:DNA alkylation repair protein [Kandleria vitulina]|uniref:DNA alkylation repair protein n=1 Tax=Kandleria vitulina TaxID=1630 RepID=UPI001930ECD2
MRNKRPSHEAIRQANIFLPDVNNWATCNQLNIKAFKKHKNELLPYIKDWLNSNEVYTLRFSIACLMCYFLDEDFNIKYPKLVASSTL